MAWVFLVSFHFLILGVQTKSVSDQLQDQGQNRTKPPGQRICYLVTDSHANNISAIFFKVGDKNLYNCQGCSLPDCSSVSKAVGENKCTVCMRAKQVRAECNLTDPLAILDFETSWKTLNKTKIQCGWTTTTTATAPSILTTTPPPVLSATHITLIAFGVVLPFVVLAVGYCWKKKILSRIRSWKERCGHEPVSTVEENRNDPTTSCCQWPWSTQTQP